MARLRGGSQHSRTQQNSSSTRRNLESPKKVGVEPRLKLGLQLGLGLGWRLGLKLEFQVLLIGQERKHGEVEVEAGIRAGVPGFV